jgi:serine/threonine-protein kinase
VPPPKQDPFSLCGTTIDGKYRVLSVVGEGGFGVVYRGVHEGFNAPIAVKCLKLPPHFDREAQEELVQKLREEGRLMLRLSQRTPGIVQALDVGSVTAPTGARVPYLILEWLEGRTLGDELRARRSRGKLGMSVAEAVALLRPAAQALAVAHAEKIAHRDIKPENLFLVDSGGERQSQPQTLKVLDFGIAKVLGDAPSPAEVSTGASPSTFTPAYGAPEQFDKRRGASGPWTDVFALALVFVELVAGRRALAGDEILDLYRASTDPAVRPTLRSLGVETSDAVERVLERALHVEARVRYSSAGEFWEALAAAAEGVAGTASIGLTPVETQSASLSTAEFLSAEKIPLGGTTEPDVRGVLSDASAGPEDPTEKAASPTEPNTKIKTKGLEHETTEPAPLPPASPADPALTTRRGVEANAPSPPAPRRWTSILLGASILAVVGFVAAELRSNRPTSEPAAAPAPSAPAPAAPVSKNAEAAALYAEALQAWRGGAPDDAVYAMEQATSLDRELSAGQIRLSLWKFNLKPVDAREHFDIALRHRATLGEKDQALLHAAEPLLRDPYDLEELERRFEALTTNYPGDVEAWIHLGAARLKRLRFDAAIDAFDKALALDRSAVAAWVLKAECLSMKGDHDGQLKAYNVCLESAPRAPECHAQKIALHARLGDCAEMLEGAKRLLSMNPRSFITQKNLAMALYATGAPRDSVIEALGRGWTFRPDPERKATELRDRAALAVLDGDFDGAVRLIGEWRAEIAEKPEQDRHAVPALDLARIYRETGAIKKADQTAAEFLRRMVTLTEPSLSDWTIAFLPFRWRAGSISADEFEKGRSAWAEAFRSKWKKAGRRLDLELDWMLWSNAHGSVVETEAEAREALEKMPRELSPVLLTGRWQPVDLNIGKVLVLAGEVDRARPHLERAARSCSAVADPMAFMVARLYYGMVLEGAGEIEKARAAYEDVLAHWGKARPKSATAEKARARLKALKK